jgi:type I restriction enzyme S subunit
MKVAGNTAALGDIVDLIMGQAPSSKDTNFEGQGTPFVKVGEFGELRPVIHEWTTNPLRMARKTDVLLCVVGATCGKINLGEECAIGRSVAAIRPHPSKLDQFYLYYFMMTLVERLRSGSVGAAQTVISKEMVQKVQIPFPPLSEQQRIVGVLDEAFASLATAQAHAAQNLQNARNLFESHLNAVFTQRGNGWVEKPLNAISTIVNGYAFKSTDFSPKASVKCIKITNVGIRKFVAESDSYLPASFPKEYGAVAVKAGCIVIALTRTIIAGGLKVAVVPHEYNRALLNQRVAAIQTDAAILGSDFLFAYLSTQSVADYVIQHVNTLMQPNLSIADLKAMPIPVPPREVQTRITTQLDALAVETQRLQKIYEQKLAALAELKKSLLHQAFSGEL